MLPPENRNRNNPEAVKSGDGLATALFYLALGLLAAGGSLAVISRSLRYAAMRDSSQVWSGSVHFYRRELPAVEESRKSGRPLLIFIESQGLPAMDRALQERLQCCVLYLIQSQDEEFQSVPGRSEFKGALEGLPHYVLLGSDGQVLRAGASLPEVLDVLPQTR
jgi:hypothetical protein